MPRRELPAGNTLLSREDFSRYVFMRDKSCCLLCGAPAVDAHHIMDRKLWADGGYYLDNGASVCSDCHLRCEMTLETPVRLRKLAGIENVLLPPGLSPVTDYDKWGNVIEDTGMRIPGPLFDEGTRRILGRARLLHLFARTDEN